jgi:hypothetical protein
MSIAPEPVCAECGETSDEPLTGDGLCAECLEWADATECRSCGEVEPCGDSGLCASCTRRMARAGFDG